MSDTQQVQPALTREEWAKREIEVSHNVAMHEDRDGWLSLSAFGHCEDVDARHALAALALHGQPFGFTHEHIAALRQTCDNAERWINDEHVRCSRKENALVASRAVAARIAALLPPEA